VSALATLEPLIGYQSERAFRQCDEVVIDEAHKLLAGSQLEQSVILDLKRVCREEGYGRLPLYRPVAGGLR
jgi:hypothetical protein